MNNFKVYSLLAATILLFYGNTLSNGFVADDIWQVAQNKNPFTSCIAEEALGGCKNKGFYYRPLQTVSYILTYQISSQPWLFHLVHLFYGFILAVIVYHFFRLFFKSQIFPLIGAVIFITHPVNSEVFNWISALPEVLLGIFSLLALIFYQKSKIKNQKYLILSLLVFFLALLSKETALFLILLLPIYNLIFIQNSKFKIQNSLIWFLVPVGLYLILRILVLGRVIYQYEGYYSLNFFSQILTALSLLAKYFLKLIYPYPLSFQPVILPTTNFSNETIFGLIIIIFTFAVTFWLWRKQEKVLLFAVGLLLLGILPNLIFVNKLGQFIFSERYLFLSTIGFSMVVAELIRKLYVHPWGAKLNRVLVGLLLVYLVASWWIVFNRNKDWKDNFSSYSAMIRVDPKSTNARKALGLDNKKIESKTFPGLVFNQPDSWILEETKDKLILKAPQSDFFVTIQEDEIKQSPDDYLNSQRQDLGQLINQGLAKIPNFEPAFIKVWDDNGIKKLQFFLFNGQKVVKVLAYPSDSPLMKEFDNILGSIRIE